jgi:AbrB family looped-hinge helix DNA binding protein
MDGPSTTRMSSRGQVVIPEEIRKSLGLKPGTRFVVIGREDVVILKEITPPSLDDLDDLIAECRRQARRAGLTRRDVTAAVAKVRRRR